MLKRPRQPMPDFVRQALQQKKLVDKYKERPPYQRNDWLCWIMNAKREETREKRLKEMLSDLRKGNIYPTSQKAPAVRQGMNAFNNRQHATPGFACDAAGAQKETACVSWRSFTWGWHGENEYKVCKCSMWY